MTDASSSSDDFDRIVEGLDLDLTGLEDFDASAAQAAAARERAELEEEQLRAAKQQQETADDQFYREVGPAEFRSRGRTRIAWLIFVCGPASLLIATLASVRLPTLLVSMVIIGVVVSVVYLISQLPDRGPSSPDWPDDGAAL